MDSQSINNIDDDLEVLESSAPTPNVDARARCGHVKQPMHKKARTTTTTVGKPTSHARDKTSVVWSHFSRCENDDTKMQCIDCGKAFVWVDSSYGTSTLTRHIKTCPRSSKYMNVGMMLDKEAKLRTVKIDLKYVREIISMAIISHDLPVSFVEYKYIRKLLDYLYPEGKHIGRLTATNDIVKMFRSEKEKLKRVMIDCPGRICFTSDGWTACNGEGYICLTAHFVDCDWKLNSKIISFCKMEPPHTGFELTNKVYNCLKEWGIEKKVFSLTLDNASANDVMQGILKERLSLQHSLLCEGKYFHVRCCAHILNLIVQAGLKVAGNALEKIRESIKYVKASEGRLKTFMQCVGEVGGIDTKAGLRLDVVTRWNSTYLMLESAMKYKRAFSSLRCKDTNYKCAPTVEEWNKGEKICEFLRPFYVITNLISGSSYPTSDLYFNQIWKIECLLKTNLESEDGDIKSMATIMKKKFDKYWSDYSIVLAFGAVLDPRAKLGMIKYCYSQLDVPSAQAKVDEIRSNMQLLYDEYTKWMSLTQSSGSSQSSSTTQSFAVAPVSRKGKEPVEQAGLYDVLQDWQSKSSTQTEKSALDQYLDEVPLEFKYFPNLNVLEFWKNNKDRFPVLSVMACDILSIPITTVASESAFSIGGRVLNKYRNRLLGDHVEALICTRSWLQGFIEDEEDLEEVALSKEGSDVVEVEDN